jgi:hypothetical protein
VKKNNWRSSSELSQPGPVRGPDHFAMLRISKTRSYSVPVVERTCDILELLDQSDLPLKSKRIAERTRIPHSTAYRILRTLVQRGYVAQNMDGGYAIVRNRTGKASTKFVSENGAKATSRKGLRRDLSTPEIVRMLSAILESLSHRTGG